jgi:hypothetical protein
MAASDLINLSGLIDDAKCFVLVRQHRWPEGACCPVCGSSAVIRDGHDDAQPCRQRYRCKACAGRFDDLTGLDAASRHLPPGDRYAMVLAGHHQPLRVWVPTRRSIGDGPNATPAERKEGTARRGVAKVM